jgi:hypothetical protein
MTGGPTGSPLQVGQPQVGAALRGGPETTPQMDKQGEHEGSPLYIQKPRSTEGPTLVLMSFEELLRREIPLSYISYTPQLGGRYLLPIPLSSHPVLRGISHLPPEGSK